MDIFEEMNIIPINTIDFSNINKSALGTMSGAIVAKVMDGEENALEVYIKAKALIEVANNIIKELKGQATDEAEKYGRNDSSMLGCEFVVKNGATSYSFDHDEQWIKMQNDISEIKSKQKELESKMVDATKYAELIDDATGEVIQPAVIKSGSGAILTITIPK